MPLLGSTGNGDSPPAENATEQSLTARALPPFSFGKHSPQIIERIKTEATGAQFIDKIGPPKKRTSDDDANSKGMDIQELLQPKKKAKKKAKAKSQPKAAACPGDDMEDEQGKARATVVTEFGSERDRWWIDDVIFSLSHAAGGFLVSFCSPW